MKRIYPKQMEMQPENSTSIQTVDDPRAIRFLLNVDSARTLGPLVFQELSASEYAFGLGLKVDAAAYRLKRLATLGLARLTRLTPRAGSPIKRYTATAGCYYLPLSLIPELFLEDWLADVHKRFDQVFTAGTVSALKRASQEQSMEGLYVDFEPTAGLRYRFSPCPGEALDFTNLLLSSPEATLDLTSSLHLSRERAKLLQQELAELINRYRLDPGTGPQHPYLVRINLIPDDDVNA
ncbi:MAG: hypothetical protein KatS3mg072_0716 [Meiothermus sp.]|nr:MAG: hypothetical protein KatS3mg072_0716 [Meiothermus sp.]